MDKTLQTEMREYAWKYFSLHSDQRLKTFNFYVVLSTVLAGGMLTILKESGNQLLASPLAFGVAFISFIFWKLDVRNKQLIKHAEDALKYLEGNSGFSEENGSPHVLTLFKHEEFKTNGLKRFPHALLFYSHWSYSTCFNAVFLVFGSMGFGSGLLLVILGNL